MLLDFAWWWRGRFGWEGSCPDLGHYNGLFITQRALRASAAKDDYKHAAELAAIELAHDGRVWWIADIRGALYYGIPYAATTQEDTPQQCKAMFPKRPFRSCQLRTRRPLCSSRRRNMIPKTLYATIFLLININ